MNTTTGNDSYKRYEQFLDWTLDKLIDEYKMYVTTIYDSQRTSIRNYLWLAITLTTANCSVLALMDFSLSNCTQQSAIFGSMSLFAAVMSIYAFISGVKLLLTPKGGSVPVMTDSYLDNLINAYGNDDSYKVDEVKNSMIAKLEAAVIELRRNSSDKAIKIRKLNSLLIASTLIGSSAALFFYLLR